MSAVEGHRFLEIHPVPGDDPFSAEALAAAIKPTTLPPGDNEQAEKAELRRRGFKNPRGLKAYSHEADYPDLYVYFDADDKTSPVNVAATKAFKCYGLDGAQRVMDWEQVRGRCVALRMEPPRSPFTMSSSGISGPSTHPAEFKPLISVSEMVQTLRFFRAKDARAVALKRDAQRTFKAAGMPPPQNASGTQGVYVGPAGSRDLARVAGKDAEHCAACGKAATTAGGLKRCGRCKTASYCDAACQRAHFPGHKEECKRIAAEGAAQA